MIIKKKINLKGFIFIIITFEKKNMQSDETLGVNNKL